MNLKQHASVMTADAREVGKIKRLVMEPHTKEVTHIVVHKNFAFGNNEDDKVVPVSLIESADEQRVALREEALAYDDLPAFEEKIDWENGDKDLMSQPRMTTLLPESKLNIPNEAVVVSSWAKVISVDDKEVGSVEEVQTKPQASEANYFVVCEGLWFKNRKRLPAAWVDDIVDNEIHLTVNAETVNALNNYAS